MTATSASSGPAQFRQPVDEVLPVFPGSEYLAGLDPSAHDVMQGPGGIQTRLPGHVPLDSALNNSCQVYSETTSPITQSLTSRIRRPREFP